MATLNIVPTVGTAGNYNFKAPFDKLSSPTQYTCKAVRKISDYLANNEDVKKNVYTSQGLDDATWNQDVKDDAFIVSLQSATGHWLYLPCQYILNYPSGNGVIYRSMMICISAPALPASEDLTALMADLTDMANSRLGLTTVPKLVETSKPTLVPNQIHTDRQQKRQATMLQNSSLTAQLYKAKSDNAALLKKVAELEAYILAKAPTSTP